jgi:cytochrome b561
MDEATVGTNMPSEDDASIRRGRRPDKPLQHYSRAAMLFHWSIAALVLFEFASALSFRRFNPGDVWYFRAAYRLHMSAGMALLVLSVACVAWRMLHTYPSLPQDTHPGMRVLAKLAHVLLYVFIVAVPITGWAILSARNAPAAVYGQFSWPKIAYLAHMTYEQRRSFNDFLLPIHAKLSYIGVSLVGLHVAAALYHHFWRGDQVLIRMLPRTRTRISFR